MNEQSVEISPTEEIIDDARNGKMFILVDHEDRENEGDLVIPGPVSYTHLTLPTICSV